MRKNANILMDEIYEKEISSLFKSWVKNYCGIDCFAILVILPNNDVLHLSTHSALSKVYNQRKYGLHDEPLTKDYYHNLPFYPWRQQNQNRIQREIHTIREQIFNLNSGTNFVRKLTTQQGNFFILYCVSSFKKDKLHYYKFAWNANNILEIGDFAYNYLLNIFQENCEEYTLPKINSFLGLRYENTSNLFKNYFLNQEIAKCLQKLIKKLQPKCQATDRIHSDLSLFINDPTIAKHFVPK